MGQTVSLNEVNFSLPLQNDELKHMASLESIDENSKFWTDLFNRKILLFKSKNDEKVFEESACGFIKEFLINCSATNNFNFLVKSFNSIAKIIFTYPSNENDILMMNYSTSLFIIRYIFKHCFSQLNDQIILETVEQNTLELFFKSIIKVVMNVELRSATYRVIYESISILLSIMSLANHKHLNSDRKLLKMIYSENCISNLYSSLFVKTLMDIFMKQITSPFDIFDGHQSMVSKVFSTLGSIISYVTFKNTKNPFYSQSCIIQHTSLHLLLTLCNTLTLKNPFKRVLNACYSGQPTVSVKKSFTTNFDEFIKTIVNLSYTQSSKIILRNLISTNESFVSYFCKNQIQSLMVLINTYLHQLYVDVNCTSKETYLILTILLIFSQDDDFSKYCFQSNNYDSSWYKEYNLGNANTGSFLITVIIRLLQTNLDKNRDLYYHSNCLAIVSNLSRHCVNICPLTSQKLVDLLEIITKNCYLPNETENNVDKTIETSALQDTIKSLLEIINHILFNHFLMNSNLIYAVIQRVSLFTLLNGKSIYIIMENIDKIIAYFFNKIDNIEELSYEDILAQIQFQMNSFDTSILMKYPDAKLCYVKRTATETYFLSYIWEVIGQENFYHFDSSVE
ncbi:Dymeclin [Intoshia linei]|uniref:Dymeclin n=1 Tax=Intoshia linei TaxID=1819745 RepID=A0A177BAT2_9BILA|nr:Dymeclin [Intoshia linei]